MYRAIIGLLLLAIFIGCEARSQVAADKIKDRIDAMLGKLDVKRKKIDNEMKSLKKSLATINEKRINAEVQLEMYQKDTKNIENKISRIEQTMAVFRPHLGTGESATIKGKEYSADEISKALKDLLKGLKSNTSALGNLSGSVGAFKRAKNLLATQEEQGKKAVKKLEQTLIEIDAKKKAAVAMKDAGSLAGDDSITDRFADLQDQVNDLFIDVETAMRVEEQKITEFVDSQSDAVSDILDGMEDDDDLKAQIDAALGKDVESSGDDN